MKLLLIQFGVSFFLTLVLEVPWVLLFGARKKDLLLFLMVNIMTNPAVVVLSVLTGYHGGIQLFLEVMVVLTEGWYYKKYTEYMRKSMLCSLCANGFSYGMGVLINLL